MALEQYVVGKAARGLDEVAKGRTKAKRAARDAEAAQRRMQTNLNRVMASPDPLVLNTNPPKKAKVVVENPVTHSAPAKGGRLAATGRSLTAYAAKHPYRIGGGAAGALALAGGGTLIATRRKG